MTFAELVDETVEYYSNNPRSFETAKMMSGNMCKYAGPNGQRCAAARLCDESVTDFEAMDSQSQPAWSDVCHMATLKPEYAHFTTDQIQALQSLHDSDLYWTRPYGVDGAGGLSSIGKQHVIRIKVDY